MKRTLFNTMMVCLAALSLAGCGGSGGSEGSGGGSSEAPVSLIGEGFNKVSFDCRQSSVDPDPEAYSLELLEKGQNCLLYIQLGGVVEHTGEGTWSAEYQGNGNFKIDLDITFPYAAPCKVKVASSLVVNIPDMKTYQSGGKVSGASFTSSPFTHTAASGCKCSTQDASVNLTSVQQK